MKKAAITFFTFGIGLVLLFFSCKKANNNTVSGGGTNATMSNGDPTGSYFGFLRTVVSSGTSSSAYAYFFSSPTTISQGTAIAATDSVTSVYVNSKLLYHNSNMQYGVQNPYLVVPPATWSVTGAGAIPSFTYTNNDALPGYNGFSTLPGSINKASNLVIPITAVTDADQITVAVFDSTHSNYTSVYAAANAGSVTILKDSLAKLASCANGFIYIELVKYNPQTLGGKLFMFATQCPFGKSGIVIH